MTQRGRGGLGKLAGGVAGPGVGWFVCGERHGLLGHGVDGELRRRICAGKRTCGECAVAVMHGRELGREKRGREWQHGHDTAVFYLGCGVARTCMARPWAAAAKGARLSPPGGARERVEWGRCGGEVCGELRARVRLK